MGIDLVVGETPAHFSGTVTMTKVDAYSNNDLEVRVDALRQVTIKDLYAYDYSYDGIGPISPPTPGSASWIRGERCGTKFIQMRTAIS